MAANDRAFVQVETGALLNVDLMERVESNHAKKTATAWSGGVILMADSHLLYQHFFADNSDMIVKPTNAPRNTDGSYK